MRRTRGSSSRVVLLAVLTSLGTYGCDDGGQGPADGAASIDLRTTPPDLTVVDSATPPDLVEIDSATPPDLVEVDSATPPDLVLDDAALPDLTPQVSCNDGVKNGNETDIDCGGDACPGCQLGQRCKVDGDCTSAYCNSQLCIIPDCMDGVKNGTETAVDCGGRVCQRCPLGEVCRVAGDCISGSCLGGTCVTEDSCRSIKNRDASATTGLYEIDPDGPAGGTPPFSVYCDMDIDGGGWTLITSISRSAAIAPVDNRTLITPGSVNQTNRGMRLPGVTEILTVNDGQDTGPYDPGSGGVPGELATYFDKWEVYSGVTGLFDDDGALVTWQDIVDALNLDNGRAWVRSPGGPTSDEPWQFDARRVNTDPSTCLQVPLRGAYGDGNHGGSNSPDSPGGVSSLGALWHTWAAEEWTSGVNNAPEFHCNQLRQVYGTWWRGVYLR